MRGWEQRFGQLHAMVPPVEPSPELFERIKQRLAGAGPTGGRVVALDTLRNRVGRWRSFGAAMTALAAVLLALLVTSVVRPDLMPAPLRPKPQVIEVVRTIEKPADKANRLVAVLQKDAASPAFILTVDIATRTMTVRPGRGRGEDRKELRTVACIKAISQTAIVGLVGARELPPAEHSRPINRIRSAMPTFAISLEPKGGSPRVSRPDRCCGAAS